jgi:hypothetical protein
MAPRLTPFDPDDWGPVVEIWIDDTSNGQAVIVTGERPDGQRFFGSFFQPTLDQEDNNDVR